MNKYEISRKTIIQECCMVEAKNKKEAIKKAKMSEFCDNYLNEVQDWDYGKVLKDYDYKVIEVYKNEWIKPRTSNFIFWFT